MHHGQSRGRKNTRKVLKSCWIFGKQWRKEILKSRGGNNKFSRNRGKCTKTGKIGGQFEICGRWLKKGHQKFWRMKIENFWGKGNILEIFHRVWKFVENRGEIWNRGNASWPQGDGRPWREVAELRDHACQVFRRREMAETIGPILAYKRMKW